ncbi:TetR/AcrR family transcriptional regulator [Massilia orientalis]|jgi:AcrR family transcriptional regulator|uniref:TetR/AcrR family transcriptional regulator n=1 Tax=Massilia orientalis TaxID=3050128 RepID=A0ACC7M4J4_9BURK|nr:TetR/AcrR family transcriptional regulator [Massilia sp. YIM B02787]
MQSATSHARAPKQGRSRQSFERIIEATIESLRERPYDQITLAEICQRAGVSTGALYGRVTGKDELLRAVQVQFLARLGEEFTDEAQRIATSAHGLAEVVPAVVAGLGRLLKENAAVLRSFMLRSSADEVIAAAGRKSAQENHAKFSRLVEACGGEIRHPKPARAIEASMTLIYASQARFLGLDSVGGLGDASRWNDMLEDLSDMMLAYLQFVPAR